LPQADVAAWIDAFDFLQLTRLRSQHRQFRLGEIDLDSSPNRVVTATLSPLDRRILREAFRQARKMQQRLALDYPG
jgi:CBS domain-containing protein